MKYDDEDRLIIGLVSAKLDKKKLHKNEYKKLKVLLGVVYEGFCTIIHKNKQNDHVCCMDASFFIYFILFFHDVLIICENFNCQALMSGNRGTDIFSILALASKESEVLTLGRWCFHQSTCNTSRI